jgi:RNA ligase
MKIDRLELDRLINEGMIIDNRHKNLPLTILNYSKIAQFQKNWSPLTLQARGLVIDDNDEIIARPFKKFFNMEELKANEIPNEKYEVYKKMDGSLGILFFYANTWHMATRGSFISEQAERGLSIFNNKYGNLIKDLDVELTYLFEIIYPENRIVVDYGDMENLVLLGAVHTDSGQEVDIENINLPFIKVDKYEMVNFQDLKNRNILNEEGYVIRFIPSNFRMKIKFEDYVTLHGIVTEFSTKKVWEILKDEQDLDKLLEMVPDEFYDKVKVVYDDLRKQFSTLKLKASHVAVESQKFSSRKEIALWLKKDYSDLMSVVFGILDQKNVDKIIWSMIKPEFEKI